MLGISRARSSGLQAAYFGAYPLASTVYANWILRHYSYKAVFMFGLTLYGIGGLLMWPAGLKRSFGGFCGATFIIGSGLGSLETAANPFIAVCGPPKYSELRINLAQSFNAVGTVMGPVLGSYAFFKNTGDSLQSLKNVQWVYLAIAIFVFCLAGVFYVSPIPEVTDADMELQASTTHSGKAKKPFWKQYTVFHAAFAQFCYTGSQVAIAGYFINYITETRSNTPASLGSKFLAGAQGCFALGRFSGSFLMRFIRPRYVFLFYISAVVAFCAASITQRQNVGLAMLMLTLFFESVCFPTIVALGIRGQGRHTKRAAGFIVGGVGGGESFCWCSSPVSFPKSRGRSVADPDSRSRCLRPSSSRSDVRLAQLDCLRDDRARLLFRCRLELRGVREFRARIPHPRGCDRRQQDRAARRTVGAIERRQR